MTEKSILADRFEKLLAFGAALMLTATVIAVAKGQAQWGKIGLLIWLHLGLLVVALCLTPILLLRKRGNRAHRILGWIWAVSMFGAAAISLGIRQLGQGGFSLIHILSVAVILGVPMLVWRARNHQIAQHRSSVRALVTGALLTAGFFTFPFGRLLGRWLFG